MRETPNDHRHVRLSKIFNEKECIEERLGDFDVDYFLDKETQVNVMIERTWELLGKPVMVPSLGGIGLFRGKLITLCGKLAQILMNVNGTSTEEYFEIIKFIEDNTPFTMLLGRPWIERDQARRKEEEEVLEQKKQDLKYFMTKRIAHLIKEQENRSQLFNNNDVDIKVARTLEDPPKTESPIPDKK
jgi:hypothetical protein